MGTILERMGTFVNYYLSTVSSMLTYRIEDVHELNKLLLEFNENRYFKNFQDRRKIYSLTQHIMIIFDINNMYPSVNNKEGIKTARKKITYFRNTKENMKHCKKWVSTDCIVEALKLCLHHNFSKFNKKYFIQPDGSTMRPEFGCALQI